MAWLERAFNHAVDRVWAPRSRLAILYATIAVILLTSATTGEGAFMLVEQQIAERRDRAGTAVARVLERPASSPYGDYKVRSTSGRTYRVAVRGPGLFENYCSCPDFTVNTLGTCKHIEAMLLQLRRAERRWIRWSTGAPGCPFRFSMETRSR